MRAAGILAAAALAAVAGCVLLTDLDGLSGGAEADDGGRDADLDAAQSDGPVRPDVVVPIDGDAGDGGDGASRYATEVLADAPLVYLRLGELTGTVAKDERKSYDGKYEGVFLLGRAGLLAGDPDKAVRIDGNGWVAVPVISGLFIGQTPFTIEAWIAIDAFVGTQWIVGREDVDAPRYGVSFLFNSAGVALERWQDGGASRVNGGVSVVGEPTHVVGTFDGTNMQVWVNGIAGAAGASGTNVQVNGREIAIGSQTSHLAGRMSGIVDEVALYDFALSAERIMAHYRAGKGL